MLDNSAVNVDNIHKLSSTRLLNESEWYLLCFIGSEHYISRLEELIQDCGLYAKNK